MTHHMSFMKMLDVMKIFNNKKNQNIIEFICEEEKWDFIEKPFPADRFIPQWYKDLPSYMSSEKSYSSDGTNATIKKCMPVFDTMTAGYYIPLPCDIYVSKNEEGNIHIVPSFPERMVTDHNIEQAKTFKIPDEYYNNLLKWRNFWKIKTPPGWSTMFVQPMHRDDLPFTILPGIVDTDEFVLSVQFPMLFRKDFEGVLKKGTPMAQVIPFKRSDWEAQYSTQKNDDNFKFISKHQSIFENRYKKTSWHRKIYK